ncbi:MAG: hypothetical protein MJA30_18925 [Cytophagales bacterium]|nr:hypothetical protein [Cytophagales bacterium]
MITRIQVWSCLTAILLLAPWYTKAQTEAEDHDLEFEEKLKIDSLALEKVKDLKAYIRIIGSKETSFSEASRVIDRALELFSEGSVVGVSSLGSDEVQTYEMRKYFERLMALNYDQVEIDWYDIQYISDLEMTPDGKYVGVITIFQRFQGSIGDKLMYKDVTKKDITVFVEKKQMQIDGDIIDFWDVLLGDIVVSETTS